VNAEIGAVALTRKAPLQGASNMHGFARDLGEGVLLSFGCIVLALCVSIAVVNRTGRVWAATIAFVVTAVAASWFVGWFLT
jgi:hypothetical protein